MLKSSGAGKQALQAAKDEVNYLCNDLNKKSRRVARVRSHDTFTRLNAQVIIDTFEVSGFNRKIHMLKMFDEASSFVAPLLREASASEGREVHGAQIARQQKMFIRF